MARCPDCDSVEIFSIPERGDGNCSVCHGDGHGTFMDRLAEGIGGSKSCFNLVQAENVQLVEGQV